MSARTAVVTGGNTGLGFACAKTILASEQGQPWHVILACRDQVKAGTAVDALNQTTGGDGSVEAMTLDLASLASVRAFAVELTTRVRDGGVPALHGLVCNAGVQSGTVLTYTADGFESDFGVNHLGHFLLAELLLPILEPPARIAVVASAVHDPAQKGGLPAPAWNDPVALARGELGPAGANDKPFTAGQRRYATSKLANVYFTYALARKAPPGVTANAFDPGLVPGTGLLRDAPAPLRFVGQHIMPRVIPLLRRAVTPNVHTAEESGAALAQLIIHPDLATTTGKYFEGHREIRSSVESYDQPRQERLWQASTTITAQP